MVSCTSREAASLPQNLLRAADMAGCCLCSAPFAAQVQADNGSDLSFTAAFILSAMRYHQQQGKCWEISLTVFSDIWLQMALAYPTPHLADYFKWTGSPFSCFCCPNSSFSRALFLARLFTKYISVTAQGWIWGGIGATDLTSPNIGMGESTGNWSFMNLSNGFFCVHWVQKLDQGHEPFPSSSCHLKLDFFSNTDSFH